MPISVDARQPYDIVVQRNRSGQFTVTLTDDAGTAVDLTGYTAAAAVYTKPLDEGGTLLATLTATVTTPTSGITTVSWAPSDTSGIATTVFDGYWELVLISGSTIRITLLRGRAIIEPRYAVT